jgi:hypothetical protein
MISPDSGLDGYDVYAVVVRHQHIRMHHHPVPRDQFPEQLHKVLAVTILLKDRPPPHPARRDMVPTTTNKTSYLPCHDRTLPYSHIPMQPRFVQCAATTPLVPRQIAERVVELLHVLDRLSACIQPDGSLSAEGRSLYGVYFTGHRALFSDSSDDDKRHFAAELTFRHPVTGQSAQFPWHGKIRMDRQYRIHFEWPTNVPRSRLPVVYIGPKLTKR